MPSLGSLVWHTVTRTTLSPQRTHTEPDACLATRPTSNVMGTSPTSTLTLWNLSELCASVISPGLLKDIFCSPACLFELAPDERMRRGRDQRESESHDRGRAAFSIQRKRSGRHHAARFGNHLRRPRLSMSFL